VGADDTRAPLAGLVAGRMYFNANTALAVVKPFSFLHKGFPDFVRAVGGDLVEAYRQAPLAIPPEDLPDLGFRWPKYILSWPHIFYDLITHSSAAVVGLGWPALRSKRTNSTAWTSEPFPPRS